ncbi:SDR family oxidoreductase [Bacillus sp. JJ1764]|uniref:SDR family oxidoreductase n=1 Tax=Bacillus sp. JJ1764 TaxID=3122964 RepID=UPI002FFF2A19
MTERLKTMPIAFITGTSSGFGMFLSLALAREGYHVIATMRNPNKKDRLEQMAAQTGVAGQIEIVKLDVTDFAEVEQVVSDILTRHGKIDLLVNNAGYAQGGFIEDLAISDWKSQFETNFFAVVAVTKAILPTMRQNQSGTIVNISSISGKMGLPGIGPYSSSKFALEGFSETLRLEVLPFGIKVIVVEPGVFKTDIWSKGMESVKIGPTSPYAEFKDKIVSLVGQMEERGGDPMEVVEVILQAVKSENPQLHYPVGKGVKTQIRFKNLLPWRWIEKNLAKQFGFSIKK